MQQITSSYARDVLESVIGHNDDGLSDTGGKITSINKNPQTYHDFLVNVELPHGTDINNTRSLGQYEQEGGNGPIMDGVSKNIIKFYVDTKKGRIGYRVNRV